MRIYASILHNVHQQGKNVRPWPLVVELALNIQQLFLLSALCKIV